MKVVIYRLRRPVMTAIAGPLSPRRRNSLGLGFLEDAEQPELLAGRTLGAHLVVAAHGAVHGLPAPTTGELWRWGLGHIVEDRQQPGSDLDRASVQEFIDR